jgi:D-alanyl-D-alanine dipeptidase
MILTACGLGTGCATSSTSASSTSAAAPLPPTPAAARPASTAAASTPANGLGATTSCVVVTTASWDTTGGMLHRYERSEPGEPWRAVGAPVAVVVGSTGLAWDDGYHAAAGTPTKREGDGKAPAGMFSLPSVFGFAPANDAEWVRAPYLPLGAGTECVDDVASVHYNTIVDRGAVGRADWSSAERMRQIEQYRLGVVVGYNSPPRAGRGSCIFLHVWAGPGTSTAGCTAMSEHDLRDLVLWMDESRHPVLVQLPESEHARLRESWRIP